jgi:hypothetical protein
MLVAKVGLVVAVRSDTASATFAAMLQAAEAWCDGTLSKSTTVFGARVPVGANEKKIMGAGALTSLGFRAIAP